jgi:ATP/maltotriose-dependent transcriptional regulator MalT/DNA-binding SARP family transcriptional activator
MGSAASAATPGAVSSATTTTKLQPPAAPASLLRRERLLDRLSQALERRLTTVVAEAGFGKSTLLATWAAGQHCAWYSASAEDASLATFARGVADALRLRAPGIPADLAGAVTAAAGPGAEEDETARARGFAALVCEALEAQLHRDLVLVLDDVHELHGSPGGLQLIESICRQAPARLHVVLASRNELPFPIERLRGQGQVLDITGSELAFDIGETRALLAAVTDEDDTETAAALQRATGGWPAALRLAVETLRDVAPAGRRTALERIRRPGGPLFAYLAAEVFAHEAPEVGELVRIVSPLDRFTPELCAALGIEQADETLDSLARRGLFVELLGDDTSSWYSLGQPVREFALAQLRRDEDEAGEILMRAARWFEQHGNPEDALRCLVRAGDLRETARLLSERGPSLLVHGFVEAVLEAVALLPDELRDASIEQLAGEAFQVRGDWDEAVRCFRRAAQDADTLPPALAWRMGLLQHLGGRLDEALETYGRGSEEGEPRDVALLLGWRASARWLRGDADECRRDAERAFAIASTTGDPQALASAHTVLAMLAALEGDRGANDAHYLRALDYAQQANDVLQLIRVRTNRGSRHFEEGAYEEAIAELDLALRLADLAGFAAFRALALTNRGEARTRLGRFEEAVADLEAARTLYQRLGSRMVAYPLDKLGEIYRERGDWTLARASYEQALAQAEQSGDVQGLVPALAGLARVLVGEEPEEAERLAERAVSIGPGMGQAQALLAAAWVALALGDRERAGVRASEAAAAARGRRDPASLAESLELRALSAAEPAAELAGLEEAVGIWHELQNPLGEARARFVAAALSGDAEAAAEAEAWLAALGARGYRMSLALVLPSDAGPQIQVQSLGRFRVLHEGEPIPLAAWQSRKARDLLKILVARRGRPTPRDYLMEALWPEQSPGRLGNRLSVLLSTVRSVLDPEKRLDPDHFVAADKTSVWLQYENLVVDVERFLAAAREGLERRRSGRAGARARLAAAEAAYAGDFLEEDAYEDWAIALREEARAAYVEVARALAEDAAAAGDADAAGRYYLRILERDPYDEPAHLGLVAALETAGRHGESRRYFRAYCARMDEIGVESAPFPGAAA